MADVRFDGADDALALGPSRIAPQFAQAFELDAVPHGGARCVALDQIHVLGAEPRGLVGTGHRPHLTFRRRRQQSPADIVGQSDTADHRVNAVTVPLCVLEPLEHDHARAFAHHEPVAACVKGRAGARGRKRAQL